MANEKQLNSEILDKEIYEKVKPLRAIDDALFRLLASRKEVCQEILRNLLDDDNLEVIEVTPQDEMISLFRGVVLDALCKLSDGQYCNIEMQKNDRENDVRRVRFHASLVTANKTPKGSDFSEIPNVKVLYITTYDALGNGQTVTHVSRCQRIDGEYLPINDGEDIIFANTEIDDETKHSRLLKLFLKSESFYDEMFPALSEAIKFYKNTERGQESVSEVTKEWFKEGYERGVADERTLTDKERARADEAEVRANEEKARADALEKEVNELKKKLSAIKEDTK
ncbi:MAG: Rpn family recombination-promoting nuclease/putative transposase [Lachnospiraceae bacterium]|nr:Rpn family recombination-promoting nuclease/putative transposase [Lachnospiraceae bacterium]